MKLANLKKCQSLLLINSKYYTYSICKIFTEIIIVYVYKAFIQIVKECFYCHIFVILILLLEKEALSLLYHCELLSI